MPEKDSNEIWQNFALHVSSSVKLGVPNIFHKGTFFLNDDNKN